MKGDIMYRDQVFLEPVLIVEDEEPVRSVLVRKLTLSGYEVMSAPDGIQALYMLREKNFGVILTDINMPNLNGLELLQIVREAYPDIIIIMSTAYNDLEHAISAMRLGASNYLVKPFKLEDAVTALRQALAQRQRNLTRKRIEAELRAHKDSEQSHELLLSTVMALANTIEAKDLYTVGHSQRVSELSQRMAQRIGLPDREVEFIRLAGLLHDIGKIGISESVINKKGSLNQEEYAHIQTHPLIGERILLPVIELNGALQTVRHHHERWDGGGYPDGLHSQQIPTGARILALADAYDAMTSERPYRPALPFSVALQEVRKNAGYQFDPELSSLFVQLVREPPPPEANLWTSPNR